MIRWLAVLAACIALLLGLPAPAQAHATLLFTTPAADGAVPTSPPQIQLVFDQAVVPTDSTLSLTGPDGDIEVGPVELSHRGQVLSVTVRERLEPAEYEVTWVVTARDGDSMAGEFRFEVGSSDGLSLTSQTPATPGASLIGVLRWLLFAGLALLLGGITGQRLAARTSEPGDPRPPLRTGAVLAVLATLGLALVQAGGGSLLGGISRVEVLIDSTPGRIAMAELTLALIVLVMLLIRGSRSVMVAGALGLAALEGLRAHPHAELPGWGALLLAVHLLAAAVWIGALVHTIRVARRRGAAGARAVVVAYARLALWLVLAVLVAGALAAVTLIPLNDMVLVLIDTTYGRWLAVKLGLVVVALGFAFTGRWFLRRGRGQPSVAARIEVGALAGVLAASAALTALAPPALSDAPLPFPPPPSGPVVALGARAGWIGIGATASQGQLVVRLVTPDLVTPDPDVGETDAQEEEFTLAGNLSPATREPHPLHFRACGQGCFVAPVDWGPGHSTVTLNADGEHFDGGNAAILVPWPARPSPDLLRKAVAATGLEPKVVIHEQVTSDTSSGLGDLSGIPLTGREYLEAGPFGSGVAPVVVRLDQRTLSLGYPAEATYVQLTLDRHDRIVREVLAAPNHLVNRTLVYPVHDHRPAGPRGMLGERPDGHPARSSEAPRSSVGP